MPRIPHLALCAIAFLAFGAGQGFAQYGVLQPGQVIGNNGTAPGVGGPIPARIQLTTSLDYWVNGNPSATASCGPTGVSTCSAGSDSNNCLSPATACLTLQHVINLVVGTLDLAEKYNATVFLAHGTSTNYSATCEAGPVIGQSVISIQGDSNATTAVGIQPPNRGNGISVKDGCTLGLVNVAFVDSPSHNAINFVNAGGGNYGHLDISNISFGTITNGVAVEATYAGSVSFIGNCSITGSMGQFVQVSGGGIVDFSGAQPCTGSSSLTFSDAFAVIGTGGRFVGMQNLSSGSPTFSGFSGVTGLRCVWVGAVELPGLFNPNSVFPGSSDCVPITNVGAVGVPSGSGASSTYAYGSANQALCSQGGAGGNPNTYCNPTAAQVNLAATGAGGVGGTLPVANGGTGQSSIAGTQASLGYPPLTVAVDGINCNAAGDTTVNLSLPSTNYAVLQSSIQAATGTFTSATFGIYTGPSRGGTSLTGGQFTMTGLTTTSLNTSGNAVQVTGAGSATVWNANPLYVNVAAAQGSTCTFNLYLTLAPRP